MVSGKLPGVLPITLGYIKSDRYTGAQMATHTQPNTAVDPGRPSWLTPAAFPFESHFVDVDGTKIHYIDEGSGPALLFVSAGFWSFMFRDVILRLRSNFRCIAP
jgi:hypothetical protein